MENRTQQIFKVLGWQGGTVHDACNAIGIDVQKFLYGEEIQYSADWGIGWFFYKSCTKESRNKIMSGYTGNLQFWLGACNAAKIEHEQIAAGMHQYSAE